METKDFRIGIEAVWLLLIANLLLVTFGAVAIIQHWEFSQVLLTLGLMLFFSIWVIVVSDMVSNRIHNRRFWILSMFIMPGIAPIVYLIQRNKLLKSA